MVIRPIWAITAAMAVISCSDDGTNHDLIRLTGITPRAVESGETVQITGSGFAEGSPARVSFRGDIFRAGEAPQHDVEVVVRTRDTSKNAISFVVNDELERAFTGTARAASHAAFRGTVTLAFAATPGSLAPVTGTLRDVMLEVVPRVLDSEVASERRQLARDALNFLGLGLVGEGANDCCVVASSQGRASMAGVKPGDRITQFDGIPVRSALDLVPSGRNRTATLWLRRDDSARPIVRTVDVQGFRWAIPSELAPALIALVFVVGIILSMASPLRRALSIGARCKNRIVTATSALPLRTACSGGIGSLRQHLSDLPLPELASLRMAQVLAVISLGGLCGVMTTREELVSGELDLVLWWLVSALTASAATLVHVVTCMQKRVIAGLVQAGQVLVHQLPILVLILVSAAISGSSRMTEIVKAQGLWPNSWLLFHDPAFFVLSLAAMSTLIPSWGGAVVSSASAPSPFRGVASAPAAALLGFVSHRLHLWLQAILLAVLLLGGWAIDNDPGSAAQRHGLGAVVPTFLLLAKAWLITALLTAARALFRDVSFRHTAYWTFKYGIVLTLILGALSLSWVWCMHRWAVCWADPAMHWAMLGVCTTCLLVFVSRVRHGSRGARAALENYWL